VARYDVVIVGAGMGGLMAGALLAQRGRRVVVAEAADRIGGYQCRLESDGFAIEPHFHFLQDAGPGRPVRRLLDELGIQLEWRRVDPLVEYSFPDRRFTVPAERAAFIDKLKREFPAEACGIDRLFATTKAIQEAAQRLPVLAPVLVRYGGDTVEDLMSRFISDRALKTLAGGWAAYFGYGPTEISGLAIAVFTESCFDGGVLHPVGGIAALADALRSTIESRQGSVLLASPVQRIEAASGQVTGVVLASGGRLEAPIVISNLDPLTTFGELVAGDRRARALARRLQAVDRFRSPFSVFLGVRGDALRLDGRSPVQVIFPGYETADQDRAQLAGEVERAPVSLGIPTLMNPQLAPAGHHIVLLYMFVGRERIKALLADDSQAQRLAHRLICTAERGLPGLQQGVVSMTTSTSAMRGIYTPMSAGALGWAPTPAVLMGSRATARALRNPVVAAAAGAAVRMAPGVGARLAARSSVPGSTTSVHGLLLAGQWTRNGPGMNNVFASAADAAAAAEFASA
jgi:prolycopene isomerase